MVLTAMKPNTNPLLHPNSRASKRSALDREVLNMKDFKSLHAGDEHRILIWIHMRHWRSKSFILNC
jgi:hypothetical protein